MTKREAAERNVKAEGGSIGDSVYCSLEKCPFYSECSGGRKMDNEECLAFCKRWLKDNPVDDWQELKIDDCEFQVNSKVNNKCGSGWVDATIEEIFECLPHMDVRYRPRQPEKEEVSHEEIMTLWWRRKQRKNWFRVLRYRNGKYTIAGGSEGGGDYMQETLSKGDFAFFQSATIPPEAE